MALSLMISRVAEETDRIRSFQLSPVNGAELPPFQAGAHISVHLGNGLVRQYSLANDPMVRDHYLVAVLREPQSRGGSAWIFDNWKTGDRIEVEPPANHFPLAMGARHYLLIAGGIGITPLLSMAHVLRREQADFNLFYCARTSEAAAFRNLLSDEGFRDRVRWVHDGGDRRRSLDLASLLARYSPGTQVYVCGPASLIKGAREAGAHWPEGSIHFEYFEADHESLGDQNDTAFTIRIASTGQELEVPAGRSALAVLRENGITVPKLCEEGVCGSCLTGVLEGIPDHRDRVQTEAEHRSNQYMALCCSRGKSGCLVLDL